MSDQYFEGKAFQIVEKVLEELNNQVRDFDKIQKSISVQLKEVARDQRYACVALVTKHFKDDYDNIDLVCNTIQNAQIEKDK